MAKTRVYISSTSLDLEDYRAKVIEMLEKSGDDVECMEKYAAADERPQDKCRQDASSCDVYVCILAWRYGFIPKQDNPRGKSITELEYEAAPKGQRLSFQLSEDAPWRPSFFDSHNNEGERGKLINDFRARVGKEAINDFFTTPDDLAVKVLAAVRRLDIRRDLISTEQPNWLQQYVQKLETSFLTRLCQQPQFDRAEAQTRYIEVLVRKRSESGSDFEPRPLADLAAQSGLRALVLGGGGNGKTTILQKLAFDHGRRALADPQAPLPFFARLNFFDTQSDALNGLLSLIAGEAELSTEELHRLWSGRSRPCLFLLDGLNEVRPEFIGNCRLALQRLTERASHTYLISSRPSDSATELKRQISNIIEVDLLHLDTDQIETYVKRAGAQDLYKQMKERLLSLGQNPFLLWAIVQSCSGLPNREIPEHVGQLYETLIDGYIFGKREVSKPQESRPTKYNYLLVKKPVLARLAVEMCRQGATRIHESDMTLKTVRDHLQELRDMNAGIRLLRPHAFMPEPFAQDLFDELVENGIFQRYGNTLEFMHESIRDYFAAVELSTWPTEKILQNVLPLVWRLVEAEYDELHVEGTLAQAVIMSCSLRAEPGKFLQQLIDHHPLLAAYCFAGAHNISPEIKEDLLKRWLALLDRRLKQYRWVGCQCLRAAKVHSTEMARRLFEVMRSDSEWQVQKSAARALAAIDDPQVTQSVVAQAVNEISEHEFDDQFRELQTDTLVGQLLSVWGDPSQGDACKLRAEKLLGKMRRRSVREALQRLADEGANKKTGADIARLAKTALDVVDSWTKGNIRGEDIRDAFVFSIRKFQSDTNEWVAEMSVWPRANLLVALKDTSAPKRAASGHSLAVRKMDAIPELLDALARDQGRVADVLLKALRTIDQPDVLALEWRRRIRDRQWPLLFSVEPDLATDLASCKLTRRWTDEFEKRQIRLEDDSDVVPRREEGWMILNNRRNPVYWLRLRERHIEVLDACMRPRLVTVAALIGSPAVPVLKEILAEKDEFIELEVVQTLGKIVTSEAIAVLSDCLSLPNLVGAAIKGLEETRSNQAVDPLIQALRIPGPARAFSAEIGRALGALHGVASLIQFARKEGMHGDEHCRLGTVSALSSCGNQDSQIEEMFVIAASDSVPEIRRTAVGGLGSLKSLKAEEKLLSVCMSDVDQGVREKAADALRHSPGDAGIPQLVTALDSAKPEIRIHAAEALAQIRDDKAIPALVKALESNHPPTRVAAAKALDALGFDQIGRLIDVLVSIARTAPDPMTRQEAARTLREMPGGEDKLYQSIKDALTSGRYEDIIQLIGSDAPFLVDDANLYWWRGQAKHSLEQYHEALADFDRAIAITDCAACVHMARANVLGDLSRFDEAISSAEKAVEMEPEEATNHFLLGWWAYRANELERSVTASRRALELDPSLASAEFNLGLALLASGQHQETIDAYNRGIVLCATLTQDNALTALDGALGDLDALILERSQVAAHAEEAKARLQRAREASFLHNQ